MKFAPKSENEIAAANLLAPGIYDFEVLAAEDRISKAGNEMIAITLRVFNPDGGTQLITDYLMEMVMSKLRHAAECCGLLASYDAGSLDANDFVGASGRVKVNIQKDKAGQYPDRNGIADYVVDKTRTTEASQTRAPARKMAMADLDDEVPF